MSRQSPSDFLNALVGSSVAVKLHSGIEYRGKLACLDGYMNIVLEDTEEWALGNRTNQYGDALVRGNNGYEGQTQVTGIMVMPEKYRARATNFFRDMHKPFMKKSHAALGLQHYAVTINDELSNPLDPQSQRTGRIVVVLNEIYAHPNGLAQHWAIAPKEVPEAFVELMALSKIAKEEGSFLLTQAEPIVVSLFPHELDWNIPKPN